MISFADFWRGMQLLMCVKDLELASESDYDLTPIPKQFTNQLFQSATSVRLMGHMQYGLAASILHAINPATLTHLCLDMLQQSIKDRPRGDFHLINRARDKQTKLLGVIPGLLRPLIGRCTALRTLVFRAPPRYVGPQFSSRAAFDEAYWAELASFIHCVRGTLKKFKFYHAGDWSRRGRYIHFSAAYRTMDALFRMMILPVLCSGNWPCLDTIETMAICNDRVELIVFNGTIKWRTKRPSYHLGRVED